MTAGCADHHLRHLNALVRTRAVGRSRDDRLGCLLLCVTRSASLHWSRRQEWALLTGTQGEYNVLHFDNRPCGMRLTTSRRRRIRAIAAVSRTSWDANVTSGYLHRHLFC